MTVNERLATAGLIARWDEAFAARDRDAMLAILRAVGIAEPAPTVDAAMADPARYGF